MSSTTPTLYTQIKDTLRSRIQSGELKPGDRVPSENELVRDLGISRMTVNRALRELTQEGHLVRIAGVGSFVADGRAVSDAVEIRNIADEIAQRGGVHRSRVLDLAECKAVGKLATAFEMPDGATLFLSEIVHWEDELPLQFELRWVNPAIVPDYLQADFTKATPNSLLTMQAPIEASEQVVRAEMPSEQVRLALDMPVGEPCLLLLRRTWSKGVVASFARLYHPASRFQLVGSAAGIEFLK